MNGWDASTARRIIQACDHNTARTPQAPGSIAAAFGFQNVAQLSILRLVLIRSKETALTSKQPDTSQQDPYCGVTEASVPVEGLCEHVTTLATNMACVHVERA